MAKFRILITGSSGYLGSHIAEELIKEGHNCRLYDKSKSSFFNNSVEQVVGDLLDKKNILKALTNIDYVFHFAGEADIENANLKPLETINSNIVGTSNLLDCCVKKKIKRIIFASTIYVYSEQGGFYRSSKQSCELIIENYNKINGLGFTILRFGSIYGGRANKFNFIYKSVLSALTTGSIKREGFGDEIRDYINIKDASKICAKLLHKKYNKKYLMITGNKSIKIKELLKMISEIFGNKIKVKYNKKINNEHYAISPYSFRPRLAEKVMIESEIELGQGIYDHILDVYDVINRSNPKNIKANVLKKN